MIRIILINHSLSLILFIIINSLKRERERKKERLLLQDGNNPALKLAGCVRDR